MSLRLRAACTRLTVSALALIMAPSTLLADITPEQAWKGWQDTAAMEGNTVTAKSLRREGDKLILKDILVKTADAGEMELPDLTLKEQGDGTVAVLLPDRFAMTIRTTNRSLGSLATPTRMTVSVDMPGARFLAMGTPDAVTFTGDAPTLTLALARLNAIPVSTVGILGTVKATGLAVRRGSSFGAQQKVSVAYGAKTFAIDFSAPGTSDSTTVHFSLADLAVQIDSMIPKGVLPGAALDLPKALAAGFSAHFSAQYGATSLQVGVDNKTTVGTTPSMTHGEVTSRMEGGSVTLDMDRIRIDARLADKGGHIAIAGPEIPLAEAALTYGGLTAHFLVPTADSAKPAPFALGLNLTDVTVSDPVWDLLDPRKMLNRDPASLALDAGGQLTMLRSPFLHPENAPVGEDMALLNRFDIANLNVKALGAEVTALGGLSMDYDRTGSTRTAPVASGKIDVSATGLGKLIDTLVKMEVIAPQQAMQARMMLSIFAISSTTADAQSTTVELRDQHVFVNGQKLQ